MPDFDFRIASDDEGWIFPEKGGRKNADDSVACGLDQDNDADGKAMAAEIVKRWNAAPETAETLARVTAERDALLKACNAIVAWWQGEMGNHTGAPYCIFAVNEAIAAVSGESGK